MRVIRRSNGATLSHMHLILKAKLLPFSLGRGVKEVRTFQILGRRGSFLQIVDNFFRGDGTPPIIDSACKYKYYAL